MTATRAHRRGPRTSRRSENHEEPVARAALDLLAFLSARHLALAEGQYTLATALLLACPSMEFARRTLEVVEEVHAERGIDLHHAVRRTT